MKDSKLSKISLCKLLKDFDKLEEEKLEGPLMSSKEPGLADMKSLFFFSGRSIHTIPWSPLFGGTTCFRLTQ